MRRLTSIWLIFMILVTSSGYWESTSQRSLLTKTTDQGEDRNILLSHTDESPKAFREEIKVSLSEESKAGNDVCVHKAPAYLAEPLVVKCQVHLRANLGTMQPQRLFIAHHTLLI
jgi:hypothetical protein